MNGNVYIFMCALLGRDVRYLVDCGGLWLTPKVLSASYCGKDGATGVSVVWRGEPMAKLTSIRTAHDSSHQRHPQVHGER